MNVVEMLILICGHIRLEKIRNEHIRQKFHMAEVGDKGKLGSDGLDMC